MQIRQIKHLHLSGFRIEGIAGMRVFVAGGQTGKTIKMNKLYT